MFFGWNPKYFLKKFYLKKRYALLLIFLLLPAKICIEGLYCSQFGFNPSITNSDQIVGRWIDGDNIIDISADSTLIASNTAAPDDTQKYDYYLKRPAIHISKIEKQNPDYYPAWQIITYKGQYRIIDYIDPDEWMQCDGVITDLGYSRSQPDNNNVIDEN